MGRERDFVHKLIHAHTANHYDFDGVSMQSNAQSKSGNLKILEVQDSKINV
jgi:hypothetical protein